ncbi:gastrokine-2-like [Rhinoderma darwinii]|uniref:gastrokine-2-like n=1 Tax=Rhinoderma darwinii TaxID=43563 RepID=UPI003F678E42
MEQKMPGQPNMDPPMYKSPESLSRKRWIVGIGLGALLIGIIVGATLIGVYMTQKHTEKMVTLVYNAGNGERVQQTITVNEQENMAAIFVTRGNYSATVLYDYRRNIIGIRKTDGGACYVLRMDRSRTPSIRDILSHMDYAKTHNASGDAQISYNIIPERAANPIDVGMGVNILCSDVAIYWANSVSPEYVRRLKWPKIEIKITIKF